MTGVVERAGPADAPGGARPWHAMSAEAVLTVLETSPSGLGTPVALDRLRRYGPNLLHSAPPEPAWRILVRQFRSVVVLLLIGAAAVAALNQDYLDAGAIGLVLLLNVIIGFGTELPARRAIESLRSLEIPLATVRRNDEVTEIDARDLVPGDILELDAGQAVPADARLIRSRELRVVEATLTGESVPVDKDATLELGEDTSLPERGTMVYKATTIAAGSGRAVVTATGAGTEVGRIGTLVGGIQEQTTPLQRRLDALGRRLVVVALAVGALVAVLGALQGMELRRLLETGIALAIAAVPEGLPVVATIAMAIGVRRMAQRRARVRTLPTVESLGSATVVCSDKTGTLTAGEMTVTNLWVPERSISVSGSGYEPSGELREGDHPVAVRDDPQLLQALRIGLLANRAGIHQEEGRWLAYGDPTEAALVTLARKAGLDRDSALPGHEEVSEVPFSSDRLLMATSHRAPDGGITTFLKGAPRVVLEHCDRVLTADGVRPLGPDDRRRYLEANHRMAANGLRVLALASAGHTASPGRIGDDYVFAGFAGMTDPPAAGVRETIAAFQQAGIKVVMLTGDQRATAEAVARDLGILTPGDDATDDRELTGLSDTALIERLPRLAACSRVSPETKLRLVELYQRSGHVVAMLGDGVNDAAALRRADVGVAMGRRGTDIAREAAGVVLADDRFGTLAVAVEQGRVIVDNIGKFVFYLFSCNLAEIMVLLGAGLVGLPLPLTALQILWLNLVTDTFPALALAMEPPEPGIMRRRPRDPRSRLLSGRTVRATVFYSALIAGVSLAAFGLGGPAAGTFAFMTLALAQIFHLGNARARQDVLTPEAALRNPYAIGAVVLTLGLQYLSVAWAPLARTLGTHPLSLGDWLVIGLLAAVPGATGQVIRRVRSEK
ncbi:MAG: cation-translocating P-type ATPase [Gemmatimonadales bacterium]